MFYIRFIVKDSKWFYWKFTYNVVSIIYFINFNNQYPFKYKRTFIFNIDKTKKNLNLPQILKFTSLQYQLIANLISFISMGTDFQIMRLHWPKAVELWLKFLWSKLIMVMGFLDSIRNPALFFFFLPNFLFSVLGWPRGVNTGGWQLSKRTASSAEPWRILLQIYESSVK